MTPPRTSDTEDFALIKLDGEHGLYADIGAMCTRGPDMRLGGLVIVFDCDDWATLHRIIGFRYEDGKQAAAFGPRIPWPHGGTVACKLAADEDPANLMTVTTPTTEEA